MRAITAAAALCTLPGCFVAYADDYAEPVPAADPTPYITYADAGCYWDDYYGDFVVYFDADVDDIEGDVSEVYAEVYDDFDGSYIDSFDLYYEGGATWYSAWMGSSTWMDCTYPGYVVDITAVDSWGDADVVSVYPG